MRAVLLVGGQGTRLRPLTETRPKPMVPLVDRPFIHHQLDHLRRHGITEVVFSCGYLPDAIREHFGDGAALGMRLTYVVDPHPLGTAGAVKNAEAHLDGEPFFVLNGDILTDLDLAAVAQAHRERGAVGTIVLTPVDDPSAFGLVRLHADRSVEEFLEKPRREELRPDEPFLINAGTYLLGPEVLERIPVGEKVSIERDTFPAVASAGGLYGFPSDAYWRDIGTHASYLAANRDVLGGEVRTDAPTGGRYLGPGGTIAPGARVDDATVLGPSCAVAPGASVEGSVLVGRVRVGRGARVRGAILGEGVRVDEGADVRPGAVVGDGARLGAGCVIGPEVRIPAGAHVQPGREPAA